MPRVSLSPIWHLAVLLQGTGWGVYFLTCAWMLHADKVSPVSFVPLTYSRKKAELLPAALGRIYHF